MNLSTRMKNAHDYLEEREISAYVLGRKINFWRVLRKLIELFL